MEISFTLNHKPKTVIVSSNESLLETLRKHHILSVKQGCNDSSCGVCTVLVNGNPVLSCSVLTARLEGKDIITVEGMQEEVRYFYSFYGDEGADQCGFCNPGVALTAIAFKQRHHNPSDDEIRDYFVGNLCRCSGYQSQFKAIKRYVGDTDAND
ncbi:MAG: (2Fe-2S)-binding protein [Bacillota bacterium]